MEKLHQANEMLGLTVLPMNPDEGDDPLLIVSHLIHLGDEEENEIRGKRKVMSRAHKPKGNRTEDGSKWSCYISI